ncbi:MAG TPA: hypothetical protein VF798_06135, partial [Burkholderiaceae bacterium]
MAFSPSIEDVFWFCSANDEFPPFALSVAEALDVAGPAEGAVTDEGVMAAAPGLVAPGPFAAPGGDAVAALEPVGFKFVAVESPDSEGVVEPVGFKALV